MNALQAREITHLDSPSVRISGLREGSGGCAGGEGGGGEGGGEKEQKERQKEQTNVEQKEQTDEQKGEQKEKVQNSSLPPGASSACVAVDLDGSHTLRTEDSRPCGRSISGWRLGARSVVT